MTERDQVLEEAAKRIEALAGNKLYSRAWVIAAQVVRKLKVLTDKSTDAETLNDKTEQISSVSSGCR